MSRSRLKAMYATLLDHFKLKPWEVGRLTDRQITELYFHPRDGDTGAIEPQPEPARPGTLEYELAALARLKGVPGLTDEKIADMQREVKEKWRRTR